MVVCSLLTIFPEMIINFKSYNDYNSKKNSGEFYMKQSPLQNTRQVVLSSGCLILPPREPILED